MASNLIAMAKLFSAASFVAVFGLIAAIACLLPTATVGALDSIKDSQFIVHGRVFCDTCRAGYETSASTYVAGAKVRVECSSETGAKLSVEGVTDATGTYNIAVAGDHETELCEAVLVSSPDNDCSKAVKGRNRARVFLTSNNGISSSTRFANALGFESVETLGVCDELMKQYQEFDD